LIENITTIVKSRKMSVSGPMRGMKRCRYQTLPIRRVSTSQLASPATNGMPR
jgi:hypothetical protein